MKKCPFCAEEIQDEAIICRYCGRDLLIPQLQQQAVVIEEVKTGLLQEQPSSIEESTIQSILKNIKKRIPTPLLIGIIIGIVLFAVSAINNQIFISELKTSFKSEIPSSLSTYILSYSFKGYHGNILNIKVSDDFDALPLNQQYNELKKLMKSFDGARDELFRKYDYSTNNINQLPDIIIQTSKNKYQFDSVNYLRVNEKLYSPDDFGYTDTYGGASSSAPSSIEPSDDEKAFAWTAAKQEISAQLKSPSTAEFPFSYVGQSITKSGNTFTIESYVDSENSYGAKVRANFKVIIEKTDDSHYKVISVDIFE